MQIAYGECAGSRLPSDSAIHHYWGKFTFCGVGQFVQTAVEKKTSVMAADDERLRRSL